MVPLFNIETDEVIFGGVGSGLYGMLIYAILAVFIAGLMVGRTPEYIGKKIEQKEVRMAMIAVLATAACILVFTGISSVAPFVKNGYWNPPGPAIANLGNGGPHGFTEMLYAYSSGTENNGSAFAGISANTPFYNLTIGLCDLARPVFLHHSDSGAGGQPGVEEETRRYQRHTPDARGPVHRAAGRDGPDYRGADVLPGAVAGTGGGAFPDAQRQAVLAGAIPALELSHDDNSESRHL